MILWFVRALFILLLAALMLFCFNLDKIAQVPQPQEFFVFQSVVVVCGAIFLVVGLATDLLVRRKSVTALSGIFFGLLAGLLIGTVFNNLLELVFEVFRFAEHSGMVLAQEFIGGAINILCCYLAVIFVMESKDDFRFIIPYVEFSKQTKGTCPMILDSSVIIDGRIVDIAATKVMNAPLVVPRFVLNELQNIADSADRLRRNRGRRALDLLNKMQTDDRIDLDIQDIDLTAKERQEPVDLQLVAAALKLNGKVITNDYNLNKVASLRGVSVININDLANALKPIVLPGEGMSVKIVRGGDQPGQGVGYLDDGTMVVVDHARDLIGQQIELVVTSALQTSAGRMIFGRAAGSEPDSDSADSHFDHMATSHNNSKSRRDRH